MKKIIVLAMLFLSACSTSRVVWDVKPEQQSQFTADYAQCTSQANVYGRGVSFRDKCVVSRGYNVKVVDDE